MKTESISRNLLRKESLVSSDIGNTLLLYDREVEMFYVLNLAAKLVWTEINSHSADRIVESYIKHFRGPLDLEKLSVHVAQIVDRFFELNLFMPGTDSSMRQQKRESIGRTGLEYEPPRVDVFSKEWMEEYHPDSYHIVAFSDMWDT